MERYDGEIMRGDMSMREEDKDLLERMKEVEDFTSLCEMFDSEGVDYNELNLAKQYEMIYSPFAEIEPE